MYFCPWEPRKVAYFQDWRGVFRVLRAFTDCQYASPMANLFSPPESVTLPLVKGEDVDIEITYTVLLVDEEDEPILDSDGEEQYVETDFPDGAVVNLLIEPDIEGAGSITDSKAHMSIDHLEVDAVKDRTLWRVVMTTAEGLDRVLLHGKTKRFDG